MATIKTNDVYSKRPFSSISKIFDDQIIKLQETTVSGFDNIRGEITEAYNKVCETINAIIFQGLDKAKANDWAQEMEVFKNKFSKARKDFKQLMSEKDREIKSFASSLVADYRKTEMKIQKEKLKGKDTELLEEKLHNLKTEIKSADISDYKEIAKLFDNGCVFINYMSNRIEQYVKAENTEAMKRIEDNARDYEVIVRMNRDNARLQTEVAHTVSDIELAMAKTNESIHTTQSNQFSDLRDSVHRLNDIIMNNVVKKVNAAAVAKRVNEVVNCKTEYDIHCEKYPNNDIVRMTRVSLADQLMEQMNKLMEHPLISEEINKIQMKSSYERMTALAV